MLKRLVNREVRCAICLARVPKHTAMELFEKDICDWCVNYYSTTFPNDWKEKIKVMLFF